MAQTSASLWAAARRDLQTLFQSLDSAEAIVAPGGLLGITGAPTADFNLGVIDSTADDALLGRFVERLAQVARPAAIMLAGAYASRLGPVSKELGLLEVGTAPLMACTVSSAVAESADFAVEQAHDVRSLAVVADLVAEVFALDRQWVGRTFCAPALLDAPAMSFFFASKDGEPYSAVTTTVGGSTVGIWSMATPENRRRQGAGRAVLLSAIEHHRRLGATTFYLMASPDGKPLYASLGFTTVEEFPTWVYQPSTK